MTIEFLPDWPADEPEQADLHKEAHDAIDNLKRELSDIIASALDGFVDDERKQALLHHIFALHDIVDGKPIGTFMLAYQAGWAALNEGLKRDEDWQRLVGLMFERVRDPNK